MADPVNDSRADQFAGIPERAAPIFAVYCQFLPFTANGMQAAEIDLPLPIVCLLLGALEEMAAGNTVTLLPIPAEMTTRQAAELLRVSRPSLIKMLDAGKLPYRKVGAHRRVRSEDALRYIQNEHARRAQVIEELVAETQRLCLYE